MQTLKGLIDVDTSIRKTWDGYEEEKYDYSKMTYHGIQLDKKRKDIIKSYYTHDEYNEFMSINPGKTDYDIIMKIFEEAEQEYLGDKQSGLYRANKYRKYYYLMEEEKYEEAFETILECYYLELSATYRLLTVFGDDLEEMYKEYYHKDLIKKIKYLSKKLNYNKEEIKERFLKQNCKLKLELSLEEAWRIIDRKSK